MSTKPSKAAIVTGASRGIGKDIALRLAADGFAVAIGYVNNKPQADAVVAEIQAKGGTAIAVQGNVADADDVTRLFSSVQQAFGRLDAVVSNAGIMDLAPIKTDNVAVLDRLMMANVRGTFLVLAKAAEVLGDGGRIVALSTSVIAKATPGYGPYIASKSAVEGLVHVLANELRGRNITVNAIAPGPVATELFFNGKTEDQIAMLAKMSPMERLGQPVDIANAVSFLVGTDGAWVNSQVVRVNGGFA
ncbi:SDR family oxidoreductase [Pollutimonas sp. M17]|uniref:SDR family oxidoreductase n=1 Tax=Pollutimonas sp. M17 TaxID=2962065 RepID=UPI0021F456E7|nr:SDR family oxidoreductase [Pollutimonas sp. M17]UYO95101.1 SDR family oxidoreductase [Pollutimonas sp. M17]HWK70579.1 SDR family oxidoreductase [Burkholderiaceae bacterium]